MPPWSSNQEVVGSIPVKGSCADNFRQSVEHYSSRVRVKLQNKTS